jgi:hypothetical protein
MLQLLPLGETAKPEQITDFLKARIVGELVNVDPLVGQDTFFSVYEANGRRSGDNVLETLFKRGHDKLL